MAESEKSAETGSSVDNCSANDALKKTDNFLEADGATSRSRPVEPPGNPILRLIVVHWALGGLTGVFCAGALLVINPLGLTTLLIRSDALIPGLVLLFVGFATMFGGVVSATAVMFNREEDIDNKPPTKGLRWSFRGLMQPVLAPVRVRAGDHIRNGR